ncbi:UNVERIFIED_CONTAM: BTB/POZ domain and ankyrin repeat-containing protein NPR1 [Sesamum calycinum]|uniref:BTB/POZ domain and ankyrin repeat-containing protein NPR1 n=1 Tax=Sesamum calycinum TaxID=2727403 RepID=A0AAW2N2X7_9LAMI
MGSRTAFSDSNDVSGGGSSSTCCAGTNELVLSPPPDQQTSDFAAFERLSDTLESICFDTSSPPDFDYFADARLVAASGRDIPVHRCILSARSVFFKNLFVNRERDTKFELKEVMKDYAVGYDAPAVAFMVEKNLIVILDKATTDDVLMVLSVANMCGTVCESLLVKSVEIVVKSDLDNITLDKALPHHLVKKINESRREVGLLSPESNSFPDKHVKRIHRALESDDVELVRMLLKEEHTNLDDAYALHYAVAYCDSKTTTELLDLAIADVNHRNLRGYTVLHVAAMRKDPKIIVSLLTKGARPSDLTSDGRKALQISKRLTRAIDYYRNTEEGKGTPKDRLCIEILEQAERRDPLLGEAAMSLAMAG